jgi:HSP20 family protein
MALPIRRRSDDQTSHQGLQRTRWLPTDPFASFEDIYRRMDQLMHSFATDVDRTGWSAFPVDIEETDDSYVVEIDLPGVSPDDVTLEWSGRELTVHGEVKERERKGYLRQQTRRVGQFHHSVTLPGTIDGDRIKASLDDGVLMIRAPKTETAKSRRIEIGTGRSAG